MFNFKKITIYSTIFLAFLLFVHPALADRLESDSYVVTFGNFNVTSGKKTSDTYRLTDTVGQMANGPYGAYGVSGYFVGGGFQYIYQIDTFSFTISDVTIDFGELIAGVHSTAFNDLTISTKGAGGYTIYAYETTPLRHQNGTTDIADTACNAGTCTISTAQVWNNQSIPGFGFNINGHDTPADFINTTYFRPFANDEDSDTMQAVMSSDNIADARTARVTYKAGIIGSQAAGNYETHVIYVAVPGY